MRLLALIAALLLTGAAEPEPEPEPEPEAADKDAPQPAAVHKAKPQPTPPQVTGPTAIDTVLACGVRLIAAEDSTLPVAAVVLAIETGTEDDPKDAPGLVHALAYHLLQGNRELAPGGAAKLVHGGGGTTSLAVGPAQIRFESVLPMSLLEDVLRVEAQRLRAPTVSEALWRETLSWARRDVARPRSVPREALAAAHGAPGLAHDGRKAGPQLEQLEHRSVAAQLADRMSYERATLIVVAPQPPHATLATVESLFASLPKHERAAKVRTAPGPPTPGSGAPREVPLPKGNGNHFVWPVTAGAAALPLANVLCKTMNRQRRAASDPPRSRVRCSVDADPRRAAVLVKATGADKPTDLVKARIERLAEGTEDRLLDKYRKATLRDLRFEIRTPLGLARRIANVGPRTGDNVVRPLLELTGVATLETGAGGQELARRFPIEAAIRIVGERK